MPLSIKIRRAADVIAVSITIIWIAIEVFATNLFGKVPFPSSIIDYGIMYRYSRFIVQTHAYPRGALFPYPPAAVILEYFTALFPFPVSAIVWMILTIFAALGCWWILVKLLHLDKTPGSLILVPLAYAFSSYFFHWDLSKQNINLIFLAATMLGVFYLHKSRFLVAGFYIALGISIKLFSILLVPYFLWTRRFRAVAWTIAFLLVFWVLMPVAVFGVKDAVHVYYGWLNQLRIAADYPLDRPHPVLISLVRSAHHIFPAHPFQAALMLNAFRMAWIALLLIVFISAWNRAVERTTPFMLLSDISILILAPVAISPYLEPYHPVAVAIPGLLLLFAAANPSQTPRVRVLAVIAFAAAFLVMAIPSPWEIRGLIVNLRLLFACGGAVAIALLNNRNPLLKSASI